MSVVNQLQFIQDLKQFIIDNDIASTTAGVCIGVASKDLITSFVGDLIIPTILFLLGYFNKSFIKYLPLKNDLDIKNVVKNFISWLLIIIVTFGFIKIIFNKIKPIEKNKKINKTTVELSSLY